MADEPTKPTTPELPEGEPMLPEEDLGARLNAAADELSSALDDQLQELPPGEPGFMPEVEEGLSEAAEKVSGAIEKGLPAEEVKTELGETAEKVGSTIESAGEKLSEKAESLAETAEEKLDKATQGVQTALKGTVVAATGSSDDDRLMSALAWLSMVLLQLPIVSAILLLIEPNKTRQFQRHHAVTSLLFFGAAVVYEIVAGIVYGILGTITLGIGLICLWPILLVPHALALYYAYQSYKGKMLNLPVITDLAKRQGWIE